MNSSVTRRTKSFFNSATSNAKLVFFLTTYLQIACTAALCRGGNTNGDVRLGPGNVISPQACISAEAGPIIIGKGNVIEANVVIANRLSRNGYERSGQTLVVGDGNVFKEGTVCEALRVGGGNVIGPRAHIGRNVVVGSGTVIGPGAVWT